MSPRDPTIRLAQYADVKSVLDSILDANRPEAEYTLATRGAAVHWRQRFYRFRKLAFAKWGDGSPYERLSARAIPPNSTTVSLYVKQATGRLSFGGLDAATKLAEDLGIDLGD